MVHTIRLSIPFHSYILSKTVQSPYRFLISVPSNPTLFTHRSRHTSGPQPVMYRLSFPPWCVYCLWTPVGIYMHGVCWRVHGWYITEPDIFNHTCMAYAGRGCGIHWLGKVYLTGLGEETDKLDSMDGIYSWIIWIIIWMMIYFILRIVLLFVIMICFIYACCLIGWIDFIIICLFGMFVLVCWHSLVLTFFPALHGLEWLECLQYFHSFPVLMAIKNRSVSFHSAAPLGFQLYIHREKNKVCNLRKEVTDLVIN